MFSSSPKMQPTALSNYQTRSKVKFVTLFTWDVPHINSKVVFLSSIQQFRSSVPPTIITVSLHTHCAKKYTLISECNTNLRANKCSSVIGWDKEQDLSYFGHESGSVHSPLYLVATWWLYNRSLSPEKTLASPKSAIFKCPVGLMSKLAGFRSYSINIPGKYGT